MTSISPTIPHVPVMEPQSDHNKELQTIIDNALAKITDLKLKQTMRAHTESSTTSLRTEISNVYSFLNGLRRGLSLTNGSNSNDANNNNSSLLAEITKSEAHLDGLKKGFIHMVDALVRNYQQSSVQVAGEANQQLQLYQPQNINTNAIAAQIVEALRKALLDIVKERKDGEVRNSYNRSVYMGRTSYNTTTYERCRVVNGMRIMNGSSGSAGGWYSSGGGGGGGGGGGSGGGGGGGGSASYPSRSPYVPNAYGRGYEYSGNPYGNQNGNWYANEPEQQPIIEEVDDDNEEVDDDNEEVDGYNAELDDDNEEADNAVVNRENDYEQGYEHSYEHGYENGYQDGYEDDGEGYPRIQEQDNGAEYVHDYEVEPEYGNAFEGGYADQGGFDEGGDYGNLAYDDGGYDNGGYDDGGYDDGGYDDGGYDDGDNDDGGYDGGSEDY